MYCYVLIIISDGNEIGVHSQQVAASQEDGMKTGKLLS